MTTCHLCGGYLLPMGTLGRTNWGRCQDCGAEQGEPVSACPECDGPTETTDLWGDPIFHHFDRCVLDGSNHTDDCEED
jgi:hypothetical protein